MPIKRTLFLLLIVLLPADGTDYLRVTIRGVGVSLLDLLLVAVLYLDFIDGSLIGFRVPRFCRWIGALALAAACLSAVSLLYVPPYRISSDVKVTLNLLQLAVTVYLAGRIFRSPPELRSALLALVASVSVVALATVGKSLGLDVPGDARTAARVFGPLTFGVSGLTQIPGPISLVLLAALPAATLSAAIRPVAARAGLAALMWLAAAVTFSRALWLALAIQALAMLAMEALASERLRRRLGAAAVLSASIGTLAWAGPRWLEALVALRPTTVSGRLAGFVSALELATDSLHGFLFGAGKGAYRLWTGSATVPHNAILDLLVAKGALTVIAFLALQLWIMVRLWRLVRRAEPETAALARVFLSALVGILAYGLASPTMTSLVSWVVLGAAAACVAIGERAPIESSPSVGPTSATGPPTRSRRRRAAARPAGRAGRGRR